MKPVWYIGDHLITPLGEQSKVNFEKVVNGESALRKVSSATFSQIPFFGSVFDHIPANGHTRFESLCIDAISVLHKQHIPEKERTLLIISTTKGNVELLKTDPGSNPRLRLHQAAAHIGKFSGFSNVMVVSNACISGVLAFIVAKRFLQAGKYDHAILVGAEVLSEFIISGFQSLHALSQEACRPFDVERKGINLGEAAGGVLLSVLPEKFITANSIQLAGGSSSNDANHISAPSRTGNELAMSIQNALASANMTADSIDAICAHGTATLFNDEMEAKAFNLAGLASKPLYSLKGNYGHTLGAAGVVETIIACHALQSDVVPGCAGYTTSGVSVPINVNREPHHSPQKRVLKSASGFGGCNAVLILEKK